MNPLAFNHPANIVTVFVIPAFCLPAWTVDSLLGVGEQEHARTFRRESDSRRWACYRAALKLTLAWALGIPATEIEFTLGPSGKPDLKTSSPVLHFNLSHCDDLAVIALSRHCPVGIDIEPEHRAQDLHECEDVICHPTEIATLPDNRIQRARALLDLWTAKEAALKAIGSGLSDPPGQLVIRGNHEQATAITREGAVLSLARLRHPKLDDHSVHLCALRPIDSVEILTGLPRAEQVRPR